MDGTPVYVVSGGTGFSGEMLVRTALAQFPDGDTPVVVIPDMHSLGQIDAVVAHAAECGALIVHTMVDPTLRAALIARCEAMHVTACDLMGGLLNQLSVLRAQEPLGRPGLFRTSHKAYFERIEAIEYTLAHDDGQDPGGWPAAELILVGVSRVGKTPLAIYLATLGWKVANVPLIRTLPPPPELFMLDRNRVIGLTISLDALMAHRLRRQQRLGMPFGHEYTDPAMLEEALQYARQVFARGGFAVIDVTDKPIEVLAADVLALTGSAHPRYPVSQND